MKKYAYDHLLADHFEKAANVTALAVRTATKAAPGLLQGIRTATRNQGIGGTLSNLARGFFGFGQKAVGRGREATQAARAIHGVGQNASTALNAVNMASSFMPSSPTPPPPPPPPPNNYGGQ